MIPVGRTLGELRRHREGACPAVGRPLFAPCVRCGAITASTFLGRRWNVTEPSLAGVRVLVVEDEAMIAMLMEDMLAEAGCGTTIVAATLEDALRDAEDAAIDLAIVDLNLAGKDALPVAAVLRRRAVPFVFSTGYGAGGLPDEHRGVPILQKPFQEDDLLRCARAALAGAP
ncbi:MAG: response regulator [Alphaproteobacteria bacterium]|nr:response regulator [Alphaproteobacteria bacterium]